MSILESYQAILLDMNSTFMFGEDRFGEAEDFYLTYRRGGGTVLTPAEVDRAIRNYYRGMLRDYEDPARYEDFPSLREGLMRYGGIDAHHVESLSIVFALHEIGTVPPAYARLLSGWSKTHRLGVVSNIWADKAPWLAEFSRAGIRDIWHSRVFSSDGRTIKPALSMFRQALAELDVPASEVLFMGDSLRVDMQPARALGMATLWLGERAEAHPMADYVVRSLLDIASLELN